LLVSFSQAHAPIIHNAPLIQVVIARTSDPEQNYFSDEFDGEGLNIDEARATFIPPLPMHNSFTARPGFYFASYSTFVPFYAHVCQSIHVFLQAAVRQMLQALPSPLNLQSIQNKGKFELKFVVQNTATKLSSDFIITYKGGDIGKKSAPLFAVLIRDLVCVCCVCFTD
jgi:hypothetical protein